VLKEPKVFRVLLVQFQDLKVLKEYKVPKDFLVQHHLGLKKLYLIMDLLCQMVSK
jgi:hypothetical protein